MKESAAIILNPKLNPKLEQIKRVPLILPCVSCQAVLPHMKEGASIINTSSITAFRGSPSLVDYSATKAAQVSDPGLKGDG